MKPTVLLTGGFGNLGGRISAALHIQGDWNIALASRTHTQAPTWAPNAKIINLDLLEKSQIKNACRDISAVIHLAALNDRQALESPIRAEQISGLGTRHLLESAIDSDVERFIFMSTAHVYRSPLEGTITELTPTENRHPYASGRMVGELAVAEFHKREEIIGVRLRCANGFGVPMDTHVNIWHVLVNDLCQQAVSSKQMNLQSSGNQQRNFIPISDICSAFLHLLKLDRSKIADGLFNLGGPSSLTVFEMAELIATRCGVVLGFTPSISRPNPSQDENYSGLDYRIDKLQATGFSPKDLKANEIDAILRMCAQRNS